ncbi:hypothetical protein PPL_02836 [Heterostelium album PN500]|uniref:Uncharacterized protein n=1 Tax=Heterostelium pallidum (strain ATCC 26659 / Pp 5 / PN500) TaxID=670386 RepID=D3B371_HETP5|nr:hypothetical protein PPL_02836 [Heterostelium album PN500]EFA83769.1 hypothetical protein PPL_02836 [Heterostelium album PN500]|eukprot:XP_020435886.1 hypothetical protein PPL_02836 [Heterostelium album PN500]
MNIFLLKVLLKVINIILLIITVKIYLEFPDHVFNEIQSLRENYFEYYVTNAKNPHNKPLSIEYHNLCYYSVIMYSVLLLCYIKTILPIKFYFKKREEDEGVASVESSISSSGYQQTSLYKASLVSFGKYGELTYQNNYIALRNQYLYMMADLIIVLISFFVVIVLQFDYSHLGSFECVFIDTVLMSTPCFIIQRVFLLFVINFTLSVINNIKENPFKDNNNNNNSIVNEEKKDN